MVWKVVDGKARKTDVKTGVRHDALVEIVEGLQAGDVVVTAGQMRLSVDGAPVRMVGQTQGVSRNGPAMGAAPATAAPKS
jgi:membrane fusion protein (multidrug efflux system)